MRASTAAAVSVCLTRTMTVNPVPTMMNALVAAATGYARRSCSKMMRRAAKALNVQVATAVPRPTCVSPLIALPTVNVPTVTALTIIDAIPTHKTVEPARATKPVCASVVIATTKMCALQFLLKTARHVPIRMLAKVIIATLRRVFVRPRTYLMVVHASVGLNVLRTIAHLPRLAANRTLVELARQMMTVGAISAIPKPKFVEDLASVMVKLVSQPLSAHHKSAIQTESAVR